MYSADVRPQFYAPLTSSSEEGRENWEGKIFDSSILLLFFPRTERSDEKLTSNWTECDKFRKNFSTERTKADRRAKPESWLAKSDTWKLNVIKHR